MLEGSAAAPSMATHITKHSNTCKYRMLSAQRIHPALLRAVRSRPKTTWVTATPIWLHTFWLQETPTCSPIRPPSRRDNSMGSSGSAPADTRPTGSAASEKLPHCKEGRASLSWRKGYVGYNKHGSCRAVIHCDSSAWHVRTAGQAAAFDLYLLHRLFCI